MNRTPNLTNLTSNLTSDLTATLSALPTTVGTNITNAMDAAMKRLDLTALPTFELPRFDMPKFDMPALPIDGQRVAELARDAAYVGVGAAVVVAKEIDERVRTTVRTVADALR